MEQKNQPTTTNRDPFGRPREAHQRAEIETQNFQPSGGSLAASEKKKGFWTNFKTAFGYGFGGGFGAGLGWALSQFVARMTGRIMRWVWAGAGSWLTVHHIIPAFVHH